MIKQLTQNLDLGFFAQTSLLLFFIAFLIICVYALCRSKQEIKDWSHMALEDPSDALLEKGASDQTPVNPHQPEQASDV